MDEEFATRWARREIKWLGDMNWTRWHWTKGGRFTLCGCSIPLAIGGGTFLPEMDDSLEKVTCKHCRKLMGG